MPLSRAVEGDQPAERCQAGQELGQLRRLPELLDVAAQAIEVEEVGWAFAENLIGDIGVSYGDVASLGSVHDSDSVSQAA